MEIKYGLISSDSHGQLGKDAYTSRMSKNKWGDRIPHIVEVRDEKFSFPVERWSVNGEIQGGNVCNCPTAMDKRGYYPQRWEEVPPEVYDPISRLKALDRDRVDAEVLFPNGPGELSSTMTRSSSSRAYEPITMRSPSSVRQASALSRLQPFPS